VVDVGELRRGMVAPDRDARGCPRGIRRRGELGERAVVIEPGQRAKRSPGMSGAAAAAISAFVFAGCPPRRRGCRPRRPR
jgi:hypothetical protein